MLESTFKYIFSAEFKTAIIIISLSRFIDIFIDPDIDIKKNCKASVLCQFYYINQSWIKLIKAATITNK